MPRQERGTCSLQIPAYEYPSEAKAQCLNPQTSYAKQEPSEFQAMARCAMKAKDKAKNPAGGRMSGYPRR